MDNYYEDLMNKIQEFIHKEKYIQANMLIETELNMPYIPTPYEERLQKLHTHCQSELKANTNKRKYDEEDIEKLLFASVEQATQAIEILRGSNIRNYLDMIQTYLSNSPHFLIRTLLIECLIEQDITSEISMDYDGLEVTFIPAYCELPQDQEVFMECIKQVNAYYENENPTFLKMCIETMLKEMYFKIPFTLVEDEMNCFIYAILEYVYQANQDIEGFKAFILEKNLANYSGYTLLLYEYNI